LTKRHIKKSKNKRSLCCCGHINSLRNTDATPSHQCRQFSLPAFFVSTLFQHIFLTKQTFSTMNTKQALINLAKKVDIYFYEPDTSLSINQPPQRRCRFKKDSSLSMSTHIVFQTPFILSTEL